MSSDRQQTSDEWTAMVKERNHHAERERVARELAEHLYVLIQHGDEQHMAWLRRTLLDEAKPGGSIYRNIASTEQRVLEEAAEFAVREECETDDPINHACRIAHRLRQQAKERKP